MRSGDGEVRGEVIIDVQDPSAFDDQEAIEVVLSETQLEEEVRKSNQALKEAKDEKSFWEILTKHPFALLSPLYTAGGRGITNLSAAAYFGANGYAALPFILIAAACSAWVDFNFTSKEAVKSDAEIDLEAGDGRRLASEPEQPHTDATQEAVGWFSADNAKSFGAIVASLNEGGAFGYAALLLAQAGGYGAVAQGSAYGFAGIIRFLTTIRSNGQKAFLKSPVQFSETPLGHGELVFERILGMFPGFDRGVVKQLLPNFEASLHTGAFNDAFQNSITNGKLRLVLGTLFGAGEFYAQHYNTGVMTETEREEARKEYQRELTEIDKDLKNPDTLRQRGLAWLVEKVVRLYNASIGNLINGRFVMDPLGIVFPPAILMGLMKILGNACIGYVAGKEIVEQFPKICESFGSDCLEKVSDTAKTIVDVSLSAIVAAAGYYQWCASYRHVHSDGTEFGAKARMEETYGGASVTDPSRNGRQQRAEGLMDSIKGSSAAKAIQWTGQQGQQIMGCFHRPSSTTDLREQLLQGDADDLEAGQTPTA